MIRTSLLVVLLIGTTACATEPAEPAAPPAPPKMRPEIFEAVNRSATGLTAATSVGVNYQKLGELVIAYATEVDLTKQKAQTEVERAAVTKFEAAVEPYKDSLQIWRLQIEHGPILATYHGDAVVAYADKYKVEKLDTGNYRASEMLQASWREGDARIKSAQAAIAGAQ